MYMHFLPVEKTNITNSLIAIYLICNNAIVCKKHFPLHEIHSL